MAIITQPLISNKVLELRNQFPIEATIRPEVGTYFKVNDALHDVMKTLNYNLTFEKQFELWHVCYNNDPCEVSQPKQFVADGDTFIELDYKWYKY